MKKAIIITLQILLLLSCSNSGYNHDASGVFEATEIIVSAQGTGQLKSFDAVEGVLLQAKQPIGLIDTMQLYYQRQQLIGKLGATGARTYDVSRQLASLRQQLTTAQRERQRFAALVEANAGNQKSVDDLDAQMATLKAQIAAQEETLSSGNRGVSSESAAIRAQILQIDDQISRQIITSPISGTVLAKYAEAGESVMPGKALFKVADTDHLFLRAYITAPQLTDLKLGQKVKVYADKGTTGQKEYEGTIAWISDKAEFTPKTIQTRDERANLVYAIKIAVANDGDIKIGMYGDVDFDTQK